MARDSLVAELGGLCLRHAQDPTTAPTPEAFVIAFERTVLATGGHATTDWRSLLAAWDLRAAAATVGGETDEAFVRAVSIGVARVVANLVARAQATPATAALAHAELAEAAARDEAEARRSVLRLQGLRLAEVTATGAHQDLLAQQKRLEQELDQRDTTVSSLEKAVGDGTREIERLKQELADADDEENRLLDSLTGLEQQLEAQKKDYENQLAELQAKLKQHTKRKVAESAEFVAVRKRLQHIYRGFVQRGELDEDCVAAIDRLVAVMDPGTFALPLSWAKDGIRADLYKAPRSLLTYDQLLARTSMARRKCVHQKLNDVYRAIDLGGNTDKRNSDPVDDIRRIAYVLLSDTVDTEVIDWDNPEGYVVLMHPYKPRRTDVQYDTLVAAFDAYYFVALRIKAIIDDLEGKKDLPENETPLSALWRLAYYATHVPNTWKNTASVVRKITDWDCWSGPDSIGRMYFQTK